MTERPLADRLALAILEHGPTCGSRLAVVVGARKDDVLRELRTNPRFENLGRNRGSRWRLAAGNRYDPPWEPLGTVPSGESELDVTERLAAVERRLAEVETRLAEVEVLAS